MIAFFGEVMEADEHERFVKYVDDPGRNVDLQLLGEILQWLVGQYAQRPPSPPSP